MNKEDYIKIVQERLNNNSKKIMIKQINNYYIAKKSLPQSTNILLAMMCI